LLIHEGNESEVAMEVVELVEGDIIVTSVNHQPPQLPL
jgi:hypothetical protein